MINIKEHRLGNYIILYYHEDERPHIARITGFTDTGRVWAVKNPHDEKCSWGVEQLQDVDLNPEMLKRFGFKEQEPTQWYGNGQDYTLPPSEGGSQTVQRDFVLSENDGSPDFIVRYEDWTFGDKTETSCSFHYTQWYPKCTEHMKYLYTDRVHHLQNAYFDVTGKQLTFVS